MTSTRRPKSVLSSLLFSLLLATAPTIVLAGPGHDHGEGSFQESAPQTGGVVKVDAKTAQRMGLKVEAVTRQRLPFGVQTTGQIEVLPNRRVQVTNPTGGTVIRMFVQPGDQVQAGQAIALLSSPDLANLRTEALDRRTSAIGSVQQAEADLRLAQKNLDRQRAIAEKEIQQAKSSLDFARESYSKDQELATQGALPQRNARESQTKLTQAQAEYSRAESRLEVSEAQAQLERAQAALETARSQVELSGQTYETRLRQLGANANSDGTITVPAPISGTVDSRETTLGESTQDAGKVLMTIVDSQVVMASANIYEKDLEKISEGQQVRVTVASLPNNSFTGRIKTISSTVEGETRTVPVRAELDNSSGMLKPGMFAQIEVLTDKTPVAVLAVPRSAIIEVNKKNMVYVQNGNDFKAVDVELGRISGNWVEITKGLFDGDMVVTQRANQLQAQSLRGSSEVEGGHSEEEAGHSEEEAAETTTSAALPIPGWAVAAGGGVVVLGTFFGGMYVARRQMQATIAQMRLANTHGWEHPQVIDGEGGHPVIPFRKIAHDSNDKKQREEA
ncbi:MAG TPA: efflux RND transporter periplasmic adaptor subunit [Allocoleopsis sp.]